MAGTPTQLRVYAPGGTPTAGAAFGVTVVALDANGNTCPTFAAPLLLSSRLNSSPGVTSSAAVSETAAAFSNGVAVLSTYLTQAGVGVNLRGDAGGIGGNSTGMTPVAGALASYGIVNPGTALLGQPFAVSITALDAWGNVTAGAAAVNLTPTPLAGSGLLSVVARNLSSGFQAFFNEAYNLSQTIRIFASDGVVTSNLAVTTPIAVVSLTYTQSPTFTVSPTFTASPTVTPPSPSPKLHHQPHLHREPHVHGQPHGHAHLHGLAHVHGQPHVHGHGHRQLHGQPHAHVHGQPDPDLHGQPDSILHRQPHGHPHVHGQPQLHGQPHGDQHLHGQSQRHGQPVQDLHPARRPSPVRRPSRPAPPSPRPGPFPRPSRPAPASRPAPRSRRPSRPPPATRPRPRPAPPPAPTDSFTDSPTPTDTASPAPSSTATPSFTASPTVTQTLTASPTGTSSPTVTPSLTAVAQAGTGQPYPNPFWPLRGGQMTLLVGVATPGQASVKVYTLAGDLVKVLASGQEPNGSVAVTWDGTNSQGDTVASGMYLVLVQAPGLNQTRLVGVLK